MSIVELQQRNKIGFCSRKERRFNILIYECMVLGFLVGFISLYYHTSYVLIFFLLIHIIGVLYSERGFGRLKNVISIFFGIIHTVVKGVLNGVYNVLFRRTSEKTTRTKPIPKEYLYNFHLKPTNDLRLQQVGLSHRFSHWRVSSLFLSRRLFKLCQDPVFLIFMVQLVR